MAPSPEHDKEPKAPDKTDNKSNESTDIRTTTELIVIDNSNIESEAQESVSTLDDVQLKSLLDEAINYKTPKDREGKSQIFKDLLQEAEEDERNARAASASGPQLARYYNTAAIGASRRHRNRKETTASSTLTHGGSLQDLAQSDLYTDNHNVSGGSHSGSNRRSGGRRHRHHPVTGQKTVSVSARQREGGSLPSNVNAGARNLFDDYVRKTDDIKSETVELTKTVQVDASETEIKSDDETQSLLMKENRNYSSLDSSDAPKYRYPHGELDEKEDPPNNNNNNNNNKQQVSRHQYFNPLEEYNKLPRIKYTSMAKVEIDGLNMTNVDKAISFSQFSAAPASTTTSEVCDSDINLSTTSTTTTTTTTTTSGVRCIVDGTGASVSGDMGQSTTVVSSVSGRTHALTKLSSDYRLLTLQNSKTMDRFKGLDENGNSVQTGGQTPVVDAKKKSKKSKVDRNVLVLDAKDIAGHQSDIIQDIDQLVKYIEENDASKSSAKQLKPKRIKTKSETSAPKSNLKKSTSYEEISKTKFTDLMNDAKHKRIKKQSTSEDGDPVQKKDEFRDRRSWGSEDSQQYMLSKNRDTSFSLTDVVPAASIMISQETAEFHVVTKKKKSKKRTTAQAGQHYHYHKIEPQQRDKKPENKHRDNVRRKSACSVPPSDKSESSDVDSVHSLPAATTRRKNESTEFNDTLQYNTSYADIARNNNIFNQQQQPPQQKCSPIALKSSEHFPELCLMDKPEDNFPALGTTLGTNLSTEETKSSPRTTITLNNNIINKQSNNSSSSSSSTSSCSSSNKSCEVRAKPTILTNNNVNNVRRINQLNKPPRSTSTTSGRPAVIILNDSCGAKDDLTFVQSPSEPIQVSGLTFGFELNEQLLNDEFCQRNHLEQQQQQHFCARFLAPSDVRDNYNHDKIVQFIGMAWEELIHDNKGKIQYYNGQ